MRRFVGLTLLVLLLGTHVVFAVPDPDKRACSEIAEFCVTQIPELRDHNVHWFLAVDVSGSMDPRLEPLTRVLDSFVELVMVPSDQASEILFDDQMRAMPGEIVLPNSSSLPQVPVEVNRAELKTVLLSDIRVRKGRPHGTVVDEAWEQLFLGAQEVANATPKLLPVLLELSDRTNTQGDRPDVHQRELERRFGRDFHSGTGGSGLQALKKFDIETTKGTKDLWVRVSVIKNAESYPSGAVSRRKPLAEPLRSSAPVDTWENARAVSYALAGVLLASAAMLLVRAYRLPVGRVRSDQIRQALDLRITSPPQPVAASRNEVTCFHIPPQRAGLPDPPVFEVTADRVGLLEWKAVLSSRPGYQFTDPNGIPISTLTIDAVAPTSVTVTDASGVVARDLYSWEAEKRVRQSVVSAGVLLVVALALFVATPHLCPAPSPPPPPPTTSPL